MVRIWRESTQIRSATAGKPTSWSTAGLSGDAAGVRVMRKLGVNYSKLRYRGATALDFAKQQGNQALLAALGSGQTTL